MKKPAFTFYRRLDWKASWKRFKAFFDTFPYNDFNARKQEVEALDEQIHYRRANIRLTFQEIFRLVLEQIQKRQRITTAIRYSLVTHRSSLGTLLTKSTRTIDRHLEALLNMGVIEQRSRTGRGLELVLASSLFVFVTAGPAIPITPAPAAVVASPLAITPATEAAEVPLDPWMLGILANTQLAERMAQKFGVFAPEAPV